MRRIDGVKLGRWSLRIDAAYCLILGAGLALFAVPLAERAVFTAPVLVVVGTVVVLWAGLFVVLATRLPLRRALRIVMVANGVAAAVVSIASMAAATLFVGLAVAAIAVDIALFAASQAVALRTVPAADE